MASVVDLYQLISSVAIRWFGPCPLSVVGWGSPPEEQVLNPPEPCWQLLPHLEAGHLQPEEGWTLRPAPDATCAALGDLMHAPPPAQVVQPPLAVEQVGPL